MIFMKVLANPRAQKPWHGILEELRRMKKLKACSFWYMFNDVIAYLRQCERCQNQKSLTTAQKRELDSVKNFSICNEASRC